MKLQVTRDPAPTLCLKAGGLTVEVSSGAGRYHRLWARRPSWFAGWFAWLALPGFEVFVSWWRG